MKELITEFISKLETEKIQFEVSETDNQLDLVMVSLSGSNSPLIKIRCFFGRSGYSFLEKYSICEVPDDKRASLLEFINMTNANEHLMRLFVDKDKKITYLATFAVVNLETAIELCFKFLFMLSRVIDDTYPQIMKIIRNETMRNI